MSNIFSTFTDLKNEQANDVAQILDDVGSSVSVYRTSPNTGDGVGFETEVSDNTFLRNILAHITATGKSSPRKIQSDQTKGTVMEFYGITQDKDVRISDVWRWKGNDYDVVVVNPINEGKTEVTLHRRI